MSINAPSQHYKGKTFFLLGLGSAGLAAYGFLSEAGATVMGWDVDEGMRQKAPSDLILKNPYDDTSNTEDNEHNICQDLWSCVDYLLISPAISANDKIVQTAQNAGVVLKNDVDMLQEAVPDATYIAVTGTSGKSTAVALIAHILRYAGYDVAVGGHMGRPPLAMPTAMPAAMVTEERAEKNNTFYVLEIAAQQLETMQTFRPHVAVLLNISPEHLERFGTMQAYQDVKKKIFQNQQPDDLRVLSVDDYELEQMAIALGLYVPLRRISVTGVGADIALNADGHLLDYDTTPPRFISNLNGLERLAGLHNWQNITCAWAATKSYVTKEEFVNALNNFKGVKHRYQHVAQVSHLAFINDSKATTGQAAARALATTPNAFWIVGGVEKPGGIEVCLANLNNVRGVYLIGDAADDFAQVLNSADASCPVYQCETLENATQKAYADAKEYARQHPRTKMAVLLSPACDSFDQFYSFEDRGNQFAEQAIALTGHTTTPSPATSGDV